MADFAAAQHRAEARLGLAKKTPSSTSSTQFLTLPPALRGFACQAHQAWDVIKGPFGNHPSFRVGQVDAELLDEELLSLLVNQVGEGLKLYGSSLKDDYKAEINTVLRTILWKLSIWDHGASYGASLQGLKYVDARTGSKAEATTWQRFAYGLLTVGGRYAWVKWEYYLSSLVNGFEQPSLVTSRLNRATDLLNTTHNVFAFIRSALRLRL